MNNTKAAAVFAIVIGLSGATVTCFAGKAQKWDDLPEPVRATLLAHGGTVGQSVDKENGKKDGMAIYEAPIKEKDGTLADLVVTADGKVVEVKTDDAADKAAEEAVRKNKALAKIKFSHPRAITNPWLPLASLKQDILEGKEGDAKVRIERTAKPDVHKSFKIGNQDVEAFAVEDREIEDGQLAEVALDYFAQADDCTVYYLGEEVDEYKGGKLAGHEGSWMLGRDTQNPGVIIQGHPKVGDKFKSEDVSKAIHENDEVVSLSEHVITPAGTYENCVKVKEMLADGTTEYKFYAQGVGVVREVPAVGNVLLTSHETVKGK